MDNVIEFISRRFPIDSNWTDGNCYYFALILKDRFNGEIFYDVIYGHFFVRIGNHYYDYNGLVDIKERKLVNWKNFDEYDSSQKNRIIRDCLN